MEQLVATLIEQNKMLMESLKQKPAETSNTNKVSGVTLEKYDENVETFECFLERFEAYLDIQNVPDNKRGKTLISAISVKLYNLLKNLVSPDSPASKDYPTLKNILKDHLNPKPLIIPSRHMLLNRKQHEGESISLYISELRALAIPCNYNTEMLNIMLRDVFVSGLRDRSILDRLFQEDDIDLDKTVKIALAMERATKGAKEIIGGSSSQEIKEFKVNNHMGNQNYRGRKGENQTKNKKCYTDNQNKTCPRCAKLGHSSQNCRFKTTQCNFCKKVGHIEKACYAKQKTKFVKQKQIDSDLNYEAENQNLVPMHALNSEEFKRPPIMLTLKIENSPVSMELDTGGAVSVMSVKKFREISDKDIQPTDIVLKTYKGEAIVPLGTVNVKVDYKKQTKMLDLFIIKENLDTIFGRDWLYEIKVDWPSVKIVEISSREQNRLEILLQNYNEILDEKVGEIKNYECKLELKPDANPIFCRPRTVPFALKNRVEEEIDRLEKDGIIEKCSFSDWATPVVPIVKPNGKIRLCADYSVTLNNNLKVQQHPLPRIEQIFSSLSEGRIFSKIDFSQAYLQMKMHPDSEMLLTINTHKGLYKCKRLMYGVNAAPAIWQKYIESVFHGLEGVEVFYDDARIASPDIETHFERLEKFFDRCKTHGLKINKAKSKFFQKEIEFLGFKVNANGVSQTDSKIEAIKMAKIPKNVTEIQSFMGLVNFYAKFSKDLATLAYPLHNLTKKGVPWKWDKACNDAFNMIKNEICSEKILVHYNPKLPILLSSDASPVGIGAVLAHKFPDGSERPIAFASRTLTQTEQRYSQIDKEALAIIWAVKKFYLYLKGARFTLITDHKPLVAIFNSKKGLPILSATRLLHYALVLQAYQFDIIYRNTKENGNADFLSRLPLRSEDLQVRDDVEVFQLSQIETLPVKAQDLAKETKIDEDLGPLYRVLKYGGKLGGKEVEYTLQDDCIMHGQRVLVPKKYQIKILNELHQGHLGMVKMKAIARSYVYWKNIDKDIESMARNCTDCARYKADPVRAKVHHWEYPSQPWERIHIDYAGPMLGHMFLIIVDAHSKWLEVYPMKCTTSFKTIECLRDCFARFGLPIMLVSDNGPQFTSYEFQSFMTNNGIKHKTTAPFKPSSNGQAERYVYTLKQSLRAMNEYAGSVKQKLSTFLMQYRKAPNITTLQSPAMLLIKREIRTRIDLVRPDLQARVQERIRKGVYEYKDRLFHIGDKVAVRDYKSPNQRWKFGKVVNQDGSLHYTIEVQGALLRRHVDQMRSAEQIEMTPQIPLTIVTNTEAVPDGHPEASPSRPREHESSPSRPREHEAALSRHRDPEASPLRPIDPEASPSRTDDPSTSPTTEVNKDNAQTATSRRSKRPRRPPQRLDL